MILSRRELPLNALRAFEVVARHSNMRRAAEELGVTHGAVSRQVKQLEQRLGVALFDRQHNRLQLTSAGKRFQVGVRSAFDKIVDASYYLNPESMTGALVIAATPSICVGWLVRLLQGFQLKYPEIELQIQNITPGQRQIPADVDVAICYGQPEVTTRVCQRLFHENYFPVCCPSLLQSSSPIEQPADVLRYPLLHDRHQVWRRWLAHTGVEGEAVANVTFPESYQVMSAVRAGMGIALVETIEVAEELQNGQLVRLSDEVVAASQGQYLVMDNESRMSARARAFVEHLQSALAL
ncbi:Glycine cleavage system transcriptional activator [Sinobacterium norvegicum]|uniref:Glycine cleavage system transcriptional activator n=1 Tax=Sinobacterium norvegicum TaxID=1641715 RepID=A0ABN8EIA0_9GAMM|nr:LysR substrate-binding domain-containing protein [Sinobacterium norvegicum]CAH0991343.1 Glycine cleavage system transcriptional activator [Sinobacterium norvegicum]